MRVRRQGRKDGEATSDQQRIWHRAQAVIRELPNTTFMVVIRRIPNGNRDQTSSTQLQASYTDVWHWEELFVIIEQHCGPEEPYYLTASATTLVSV